MRRNWLSSLFAAAAFFIMTDALSVSCTPDPLPDDNGQVDPAPDPDPSPDPIPEPNPGDGILRILAIGNSFSQDAVEQYLWDLFNADGQEVVIGNLYIGGCTLETHYKNMMSGDGKYAYRKVVNGVKTETSNTSLKTGIEDENWDIITLQQASGVSGMYETYNPHLPYLVQYIRKTAKNKKVKLGWHMTWSYSESSTHAEFPNYDKDQMKMYNAIVSCAKKAVQDNTLDILIPSGTAIQNARTSYMGDTFNRDGYHLEVNYGRYTAACTWYEAIRGKSVVGNTYKPEKVADNQRDIAQNAAHMAIEKPYVVTDMLDFKTPITTTPEFSNPVFIDFGGGSTAPSAAWNRVTVASTDSPIYLTCSDEEWSPISITSLEEFTSVYNGVGGEPDKDIKIGDYTFPKAVWADGILISGTKGEGDKGPARVCLAGFDAGTTYKMSILAVRFNGSEAARTCEYQIKGSAPYGIRKINPGMKTWPGDEADFSPYMVTYDGVKPASDGTLRIEVKAIDTTLACDGLISAVIISKK